MNKLQVSHILRFSVALAALLAAFVVSITASRGWPQFDWRGTSILAQPKLEEGAYDLSSILTLNRVLLHLRENYVDISRSDPQGMLVAGLDRLQKRIPEVVVTFERPPKEGPKSATIRVGEEEKKFTFDDIDDLWEMSLKYQEMFRFIQAHLSEDISRRDVEYAVVNGMLKTLDPHSVLLTPEYYKSMKEGNRGNFGGLGIVIRMIDGYLTVINPMSNTPASRAGIAKNDRIAKIGDISTFNMELGEIVNLLRGKPGTKVTLHIEREGDEWDHSRPFVLTRDTIKIPSVKSAALDLDKKLGYIHLSGFQGNTYDDMVGALKSLKAEMGEISGLVLDLRGNPGGLLDQAIQISDKFLDSGMIVTTVGSGMKYRKPYPAKSKGTEPFYPIVVLIDSGSASASEIVAGALKNHNRALILGDRSFGKGSVQVLYELNDGSALKMTIAQYLTPGDLSIQSVGIIPDIGLSPMSVGEKDFDMFSQGWVRREATLKSHLDHDSARRDEKSFPKLRYLDLLDPENPHASIGDDNFKAKEDPQVRLAQSFLIAAGDVWKREELVTKLAAEVTRLSSDEDSHLVKALSDRSIDWSKGPKNKGAKIKLELKSDLDLRHLNPGDSVVLTATATNKGEGAAHRVFGLVESSHPRFDGHELIFGKIAPGESVSRSFTTKLAATQRARFDSLSLPLHISEEGRGEIDAKQAPLAEATLELESRGVYLPHFAMAYSIIDDLDGSGDGQVSAGEEVHVRVYVKNKGRGSSNKPIAFLRNLNGAKVELLNAREEGDAIPTGGDRLYDFNFKAAESLSGDKLDFEIHLFDRVLGQTVVESLSIPIAAVPVKADALLGSASITVKSASIFSLPSTRAHVFAKLPKDFKVEARKQSGKFLLVTIGKLQGWMIEEQLTFQADVATPVTTSEVEVLHVGSPPRISIDLPKHVTRESSIQLKGEINDEGDLKDIYAFVYSGEGGNAETRKVTYQNLKGSRAKINLKIPLREGLNRIKVITRDNDEMESSESLYIYRR